MEIYSLSIFSIIIMFFVHVEPEFCFINDTPHVEGLTLEVELQLLGCASLTCADSAEPFTEDCKCVTTTLDLPSCLALLVQICVLSSVPPGITVDCKYFMLL